MKINEVTKSADAVLFESLDKNNDTGFATTDLVKIVNAHRAGQWDESSFDDELARLDMLAEQDNG